MSGQGDSGVKDKAKRDGGGRYGFDDYPDSPIHDIGCDIAIGTACPHCGYGKFYESDPQRLLEFTGHAPLSVKRYQKQVLRCNACGACASSSQTIRKWQDSARSAIVLQKVHGMPFHRLSKLQNLSGVPVACSTLG